MFDQTFADFIAAFAEYLSWLAQAIPTAIGAFLSALGLA